MRDLYKKKHEGFTLVELLVASTVLLVVTGMVLNFTVENLRATYVSEQKNQLNNDVRRFTQELSRYAKDANYFRLYNSFDNVDRDGAEDHLTQGNAGNFLLLVHLDEPDLSVSGVRPINKLVGYFLDVASGEAKGKLRKMVLEFDPSTTAGLESLLPDESTNETHQVMMTETQGISDEHLFYNLWDKSILVNGYLTKGNDHKRITEAYNFTVSPRG